MCLCGRKRRIAREVSKRPGSGGTLVPGQQAEGGHWRRSDRREGPGEWGGGNRNHERWGWGVRCKEALASLGDFGDRKG